MASRHERTGVYPLGRAAIALAVAVLLHFSLSQPAWAGTDEAKSGPTKHATVPVQKDASSSVPKDSTTTCVGTVQTPSENASRGTADNTPDAAASPDSENQSNSETMKYRLRLSGDRNQDSASEPALSCERPKLTDRPKTTKCDPSNPDEANSPDCKSGVETSPK